MDNAKKFGAVIKKWVKAKLKKDVKLELVCLGSLIDTLLQSCIIY